MTSQEKIHIRRTADYVNKQIRDILNSNFLGKKISTGVSPVKVNLSHIQNVVVCQLNSLKSNSIIENFRNVNVIEDPIDPGVLKIELDYIPPVSLSYIKTTFAINDIYEPDEITIEERLVRYLENKPW